MKIGDKEIRQIVVTKDEEIIAIISDNELVEKDGTNVILQQKPKKKISELDRITEKNMSVKEAAQRMGKSEQFVRIGLQRGLIPFGFAVKCSGKYSYHISPKLFEEYLGNEGSAENEKGN